MTSTSSSTLKSSSLSLAATGGGSGTLTSSTGLMNSTSSMMMNTLTGGTIGSTMANKDGVVLQGYHKKLKTMKKKYFVLCAENGNSSARLEYYDSERKFKSRSHPKRTIILKNCFNINRRLDTKHKYVIALSTKEEGFCIVLDSEEELNKWLRALLALQRGEDTESDPPKPTFEHVWQVQVQRKGLAEEKGIIGSYYVCLTTKSLSLVRIGPQMTSLGETRLGQVEFYLTTIRRCGGSQCYFFMEVGRNSAIGAGELWMETEDTLIAQNMYQMIFKEMSSKSREENSFGPMRKRSSSANEASKPISVLQRRQTHTGNKPLNSSPLSGSTMGRDRCDSLPSTRNRTISECSNHSIASAIMPPPRTIPSRPHSVYSSRHSHSPPMNTALSPSTGCSESDGSSVSIDETDSFVHSLTPDDSGNFVSRYYNSRNSGSVIPEENADDFWCGSGDSNRHTLNGRMSHNLILMDKLNNQQYHNHHHNHYNHHNHQQQQQQLNQHQHQYHQQNSCFCNSCCCCCCNVGGSVSGSNGCCNNSVSSTNCANSGNSGNGSGCGSGLSLPISSSSSMTSNQNTVIRKCSPSSSNPGSTDIQSNQYMEMYSPYSPCGSSPCEQIGGGHSRASSLAEETVDGYVPMCPGQSQQDYVDMDQNSSSKQQNLSELSSAASSCSITSGTPSTDIRFAEYPLDKVKSRFTPDDEDIHPGAERPIRAYSVGSRLEHNKRKYRTDRMEPISGSYTAVQDQQPVNARVRAFSVGSRAKVPRCDLYRGILTPNLISSKHINNNNNSEICVNSVICSSNKGKKSSSAPILVHKSQSSVDRMSDLMEIDYSKNNSSSNTSSLDHQYKDEYDEQRIFNNNNNNNNIHNVANNNNFNNSNNNIYNNGKNNNIYNNSKNMTVVTSSPLRQSSFPVNVPSPRPAPTTCDFYGSSASPKLTMMNTVQGYVEMKPGSHSNKASPSTSLKSTDNGYLEMKPIGLSSSSSKNASLSSSPVKTFSSPKVTPHSSNNSMTMDDVDYCRSGGGIGGQSYDSVSGAPDYMNVSPTSRIRSISNTSVDSTSVPFYGGGDSTVKPMEIDNISVTSGTPDGYMEMSWGKSTGKTSGSSKENDKTSSNNNSLEMKRSKSRPIDIKTKDKGFILNDNGLPLTESFTNASSTTKLCCRSNSKDSNDIIMTTDSHLHQHHHNQQQHATIFPFSLSSPTKSFLQQNDFTTQRKCLVDATSGTVTISEEKPSLVSSDKSAASSALAAAIGLASPPQKRMNMSSHEEQIRTIIGKGEDNDIIVIEETEITPEKYKILNTDPHPKFECLSTTNNKVEALTNDYADMSLRSDNYKTGKENTKPSNEKLTTTDDVDKNTSNLSGDYVNYAPPTGNDNSTINTMIPFPKSKVNDSSTSDYTIMRPSASKKVSTTVITSLSSPLAPSNLGNKGNLPLYVPLTSGTNTKTKNFEGLFKPISVAEKEEIQQLQKEQGISSPKGGAFSVSSFSGRNLLSRNSSRKNLTNVTGNSNINSGTDDNGYELLHMRSDSSIQQPQHPKKISRPNSVNSEKISPLKYGSTSSSSSLATLTGVATTGPRPNSANGDCIQNQSISTSSSTSTLCGINMSSCSSSSSTLCGSKSQSPLATNSRPQSFNDNIPLSPLGTAITAANPPSSNTNHEQSTPSRPPSVSSERELHYASLDLPPPSSSSIISTPNSAGDNNSSSITGDASNSKISIGNSSSVSPSPNANNLVGVHQPQQSSFTYAQIDFNKSETLKLAMIAAAATAASSVVTPSSSNTFSTDTGSGGGSSNE